jgi:hypothetical protein
MANYWSLGHERQWIAVLGTKEPGAVQSMARSADGSEISDERGMKQEEKKT